MTGSREVDRFEHDRVLVVADRVAGRDRPQSHRGADIARQDFLDLFALVGVHAQQAADALLAPLRHVENRIAGLERSRIHPEKRQLADVRVGHDLEYQRGERLLVGSVADQFLRSDPIRRRP